ncbi:hypothetical protein ACM66B_006219 [Microbotryomycetes sp. NB124-2]
MPRQTRVTDANAQAGPSTSHSAVTFGASTTAPGGSFDLTNLDPNLAELGSTTAHEQDGEGADDDDDDESGQAGSADDYSDADDLSIDAQDEDDDDDTDAENQVDAPAPQPTSAATRQPGRALTAQDVKGKGKARDAPLAAAAHVSEPAAAESDQINRLIHAMRDTQDFSVAGRTALDREFDRTIEEELDDMDDLEHALQGKKKSSTRRSRAEAEPSPEVKNMLNQANQLYAQGDYDDAIVILEDIIRIDPNLRVPWYTLASIFDERDEPEKALMFKIIATHLLPLSQAAPEWADLGNQSRDLGLQQQAVYCYTQATKGDREDTYSIWDLAMLLKLNGEKDRNKAIKAFLRLLEVEPHDPGALRELCPLLISNGQPARASELYMAAFEHYKAMCPDVNEQTQEQLRSFGYDDLEFLADYLNAQHKWADATYVVRTGVRWLQGRFLETTWDELDDDREFDLERKKRPDWHRNPVARRLEDAPVYPLDPSLRLRLGLARLGMNYLDEAHEHFEIIRALDPVEFADFFMPIATAYMDKNLFAEALTFLHDLADHDETNDKVVWQKIGQCCMECGDYDDARECFEAVIEEDPDNYQCKMQLARVFEAINDPQRALELLREVIRDRQRLGVELVEDQRANRARARSGRSYATREHRAEMAAAREALEQRRVQEYPLAFAALGRIELDVENGNEDAIADWLEAAEYLVDAFRETRQFFPSDSTRKFTGVSEGRRKRREAAPQDIGSQANEMASRLERSMNASQDNERARQQEMEPEVDTFRGIHFDDWVGLILKYAFLLAKRRDEVELAVQTLEHVQSANVFRQHLDRSTKIKLGLAAVHAFAGHYVEATDVLRVVFRPYQLRSEGLRLLYGLLSQGMKATLAFNATNLAKYMLRQLRAIDSAARGNNAEGRGAMAEDGEDLQDEDDQDQQQQQRDGPMFVPTKPSPTWNLAYGHLMQIAPSGTTSLIYLLRAYELAPKQPLINLSLSVAYTMRAMSRQTDNRHHQLAQALGFFDQYRRLRGPCQEVEYNAGRFFHHLGLHSAAVEHYHNCLDLATRDRQLARLARMQVDDDRVHQQQDVDDKDDDEPNDFARVAAYNLSNLYMLSGQDDLARMVAADWLAI